MKYSPYQHTEVMVNGLRLTRPVPKTKKPLCCKMAMHKTFEFELTEVQADKFIAGQYPRYCAYCNHTVLGKMEPHISEKSFGE
ncbi:hypothetical protein VPHK45_0007 [Vibrio phage K45]